MLTVTTVVGLMLLTALLGDSATAAAARRSKKLAPLTASFPKSVEVGEPFSVTVRNLRIGSVVAVETPEFALGWASTDGTGSARVTSSLWRPQPTKITVTEVLKGVRGRKVSGLITVRNSTFAPPQTSPSPSATATTIVDPTVTVVAAGACRSQSDPIRLWALGDSLTVGGYGDPSGFTDSYRYVLFRLLRAEGQRDIVFRGHIGAPGAPNWGAVPPAEEQGEFSHSGIGGINVVELSALLDTITSVARPDVIVVNIGTNGGTPADYRQLIAKLQQLAPTAVIVMGTLPPRTPEIRSRRPVGFRAEINATALALGTASSSDRLFTADVFNRMLGDANSPLTTADYSDETHLSISGGAKFAQALLPEVREAIALFRATPCG